MQIPNASELRVRIPAAVATLLFHIAIIIVFLNAIPKYSGRATREIETIIHLTPQPAARPAAHRQAGPSSTALSRYYYRYIPSPLTAPPNVEGLKLAVSSCAPEKMVDETAQVREACRRIGLAVAVDPGAFGVTTDFTDGKRWERELQIKQTPLLLPCASPAGLPLNLGTALCLADMLLNGYDPRKMQHYSK